MYYGICVVSLTAGAPVVKPGIATWIFYP